MTTIKLENLNFNYTESVNVFNSHSLILNVDETQPNKLYGVIGPSGTGKTTLLSILGGQLNPDSGNVLINNINIYKVDDEQRRNLIALQMQTATSLKGTLKYNLLFGIFDSKGENTALYSDDELITVLKKVGLWKIFETKAGLETMIGEGGLNLSGGQRQRLNFAGLYLRVKYYKPVLVLIDEPTSSLDEISEKSITAMINEIAQIALTLVVAHRLVTVNEAVGLLDTSLIEKNKHLIFYSNSELKKFSQYYNDLIDGKATLDE